MQTKAVTKPLSQQGLAVKQCEKCGEMIERIKFGLHMKTCKETSKPQPAELDPRLKLCDNCGETIERLKFGWHKKNCATMLEKAAAKEEREKRRLFEEQVYQRWKLLPLPPAPLKMKSENPAEVDLLINPAEGEAASIRESSPMSRISTAAPTSPSRLEDLGDVDYPDSCHTGGYPRSQDERRHSALDAKLWDEIKNQNPIRFVQGAQAHQEAVILMSTPEYGLDDEPVMENLLHLMRLAPQVFYCAFDRKGEGLSTFQGDEAKFEAGIYEDTDWAKSYMGRAAGAVQQIYSHHKDYTILRFICIDGGPVTQYEQMTLTQSSFRNRISQEIRKHHHDANIVVEVSTLSYDHFLKEVDHKHLLGESALEVSDISKLRFEAVLDEAMLLPMSHRVLDRAYKTCMKELKFDDAKFIYAKRLELQAFYELLQERFDHEQLMKKKESASKGMRGMSIMEDISTLEEYSKKMASMKQLLLGHKLPAASKPAGAE